MTIYENPSRKAGRVYRAFTARFCSGVRWTRIVRSKKRELHRELEKLLGGGEEVTLRGPSLREYERSRQLAKEMAMEIDEALLQLKKLDADAREMGSTIPEALAYFARHHDQTKFSTPCRQVVDAFLTDRKAMGNSAEDIATLRCRLHRFAAQFACPLRDITKDQYRTYFAATGHSLRDRRNHRASVGRLVNWAKANDYLPADHPGIPQTGSRVRIPAKRVEVFDREQRELLIAQARPVELPLTLLRLYRSRELPRVCSDKLTRP